jgi:hypothetical protein
MRYFTRQQHDAYNSTDPAMAAAAIAELNRSCDMYRRQLDLLKARLPESVWTFFDSVSLHDGTLIALRVGDDIDKRFPTYGSILVNKRHLSVDLEVLNREETLLCALRYDRLHRVAFDFPTAEPWYSRFADRGSNPIDDWMSDELTAIDERLLRHEVLFSSGATLLLDFETISVRSTVVEGRRLLPYIDPDERADDAPDAVESGT